MKSDPIYLDHHATTPCDPRVVAAMMPCFGDVFGNPASRQHAVGRRARAHVEAARTEVASLLGCAPAEIVFTSGATESDNLAIKGVVGAQARGGHHVVTAVTEHKAVLDTCAALEHQGIDVTYLPVETDGRVDPARVGAALRDDTVLVSLMLANNEIGVVHPIAEIAALCKERGILLHADAAQALAYLDCDVDRLGVDLLSISSHKAYGPKGVGALYCRRKRPRVRVVPQLHGGGHERGRRSGTLNVPGIVGLGRACALIAAERSDESSRVGALRDDLLSHLVEAVPSLRVHGSMTHRLPNNLNVSVPGLSSEALLEALDSVAVSSGAACSAANADGSYVLKALPGAGPSAAESSIRIGLGRYTTEDEVRRAARDLVAAIHEQLANPVTAVAAVCGA